MKSVAAAVARNIKGVTIQIDVYYYLLTRTNKIFGDFPIGTVNLEDAFRQYAQAVKQLALTHLEKRTYLDLLVKAFSWEMCGYGVVAEAIEQAIDSIGDSVQDYHYVIDCLKRLKNEDSYDLIARYYLKLHDEKNYLNIRMRYRHYSALQDEFEEL